MSQEQEMVYAIHPYQARRNDEIDFDYGEPIIVIERDDMYGDGWWKGQNIHGKIGLFPMSHIKSYNSPKFDNIPIISSPEPYKINDVDSKENISNSNSNPNSNSNSNSKSNSIINDTIEDLRNKLQVMINFNSEGSSNSKRSSKKGFSRRSRLSTSTESTSSYFSARINSDISSSRNSLYQHSQMIYDPTSLDDDDNNNVNNNINIKNHPSTWDVHQVCQWLNENGFSSETRKFVENDVTGDVLLGLDIVALKEININSFGKRVHLLNTIASLKDQYSINNSDHDIDKAQSKSQFGDSDLSDIHFNDTLSDSQHTSVSNIQLNNRKSDVSPASYYNALSPPSPPLEKSEKSEKKVPKKSSLTFLKFGPFGKSNKDEKAKKSEKSEKSEKSRPSLSGGWDFALDDDTRESEKLRNDEERSKNKIPSILYDETISTSLFGPEKNSSLKFIPGRKKKFSSLDRKGVVGSQLGFPKDSLDNVEKNNLGKRESRVNSYYSEHNIDYINTNNDVLKKIGIPDHDGWLKKQGDKYRNWKTRFCILKGSTLYYLKGDKSLQSVKIKGQIELTGYKVVPDENVYQGKYGFKLLHDTERPHFFVHEDLEILRGWMRAIMKTTIDIGKIVTISSSDHIQTVSLHEARKMANRMHQPRLTPSPPNILIDNSTSLPSTSTFSNLPPRLAPSPPNILMDNSLSSNIFPSTSTFSNLPPRSAPSPPNVLIDNSLSSNIFPSTSTFSNLPPRSAPSPPNILMDNSLSSNIFPSTSTFSNLPPRSAPSPPNILMDNSLSSSNIFPSTFSNLPPRPAPSPPISEYKLITTIPLSSLPKPKAPPTGAPPPPPSHPSHPSPLPEHDHSLLRKLNISPPPPEHGHSSHKVIKSPPLSPTLASRTKYSKYSKSQIPNSPTKIPKFPSMTLSILNASRTPPYIPKNNKYNELSMGYV